MDHPKTAEPTIKSNPAGSCTIAMLLLENFNNMAAQAFIDPFRAANYLKGQALYNWPWLSLNGNSVIASNSAGLGPAQPFDQFQGVPDFLVVNASWTPERYRTPGLQNWLRRLAKHGAVMCGLDTGAFVLAYAGLMDGYKASVHYEHIAAYRELFAQSSTGENLFTFDRDRLTCCGGLAAADMALEIIRLQQGLDLANAAGRYIFHERVRAGGEGQLPAMCEPVGYAAPKRLRGAILLMERNLEEPLSVTAIAEHLGASQRQLERLFHIHTGVSPLRYYIDVRLDRARGLLTQTDLPVCEVAAACGFNSPVHFSRTYKARFGITPTRDRTEGRVPFQFRSFPNHAGV